MLIVYRYRVKSNTGLLNKQARSVNYVFNYCNETQSSALRWGRRWPTGFDLNRLTTGSAKDLGLHSGTVNAVCEQYAKSRSSSGRRMLRWRTSKRSLGWVPVKGRNVKETPDGFHFHGREFKVFKSRALPGGAKIKDGTNFSCDRKGNWFLNVCIEVAEAPARQVREGVGIDLGLNTFATLSTGEAVENPRHFRALEARLANAQRAGKKRLATGINAKICNARRDFLHKLSTRIVSEYDYIAVGNASSAKFARTRLAKSVYDAAWSSFRYQLAYKAMRHGATFEQVDESWSTRTCNICGLVAGPKGRAGLKKRIWICGCGTTHDRDVNAARNILLRGSGQGTPVEGAQASGHRELSSSPPCLAITSLRLEVAP